MSDKMGSIKIDTKKQERLFEEVHKELKKFTGVRVGYTLSDTEQGGFPLYMLALIHELGSPAKGIPPRPFIRNAMKNADKWRALFNKGLKQELPLEQNLKRVREMMITDLKDSFTKYQYEPNKPATIRAKKSDRPLIDTGTLRSGVRGELIRESVAPKSKITGQ